MNVNKKSLLILSLFLIMIFVFTGCSRLGEETKEFYTVTGEVVNNDDIGISEATIVAQSNNQTTSTTKPDKNGNFKITVPKDKAEIIIKSDKYEFEDDTIIVNQNIRDKKILGYLNPDVSANSNLTTKISKTRQEISTLIKNRFDPDNQKQSIQKISDLITDPDYNSSYINIAGVENTSNSITVKYKDGGNDTWILSQPTFGPPDDYILSSFQSEMKNWTENVTPGNNEVLIVNNLNQKAVEETKNILEHIENSFQNMGYKVDLVQSTSIDIFSNLDNYGIVYLQTYSGQYNDRNLLLTGERFNSLTPEKYRQYMTGKIRLVALPEDDSFNYYWAVTDKYFNSDNFDSENNTIIFSSSGGLMGENGLADKLIENGASAFIGWKENYNLTSEESKSTAPWSIFELIKGMRNQISLQDAYNKLQTGFKNNLGTSLQYSKADDQDIISISTDLDNNLPVMEPIKDKTINENQELSFQVSGSDPDGDSLTYEASGDLSEYFNPETRTFSWKPGFNDAGKYKTTFSISDGKMTVSETITITVKDQYKEGTEKWSFNSQYGLFNSPAIDDDGTIYIFANEYLYALNDDSTIKWYENIGSNKNNNTQSSAAVGEDGTVYYGKDKLYALDSDGTLKWTFNPDSTYSTPFISRPAISEDGTIYIASYHDDKLYAIYERGDKKWEIEFDSHLKSAPVVGNDGTIYIADINGNLYAYLPDKTLRWKFDTNDEINSSPAIDNDGTIYIGSNDGNLYAIKPNGREKWSHNFISAVESSPAIGKDGTIYVGANDGSLYALNNDGSEKWSFETGKKIGASSPAVAEDGTIYIGSRDNKIYAVNPDGAEKWSFQTNGSIYTSPAIAEDGTVYITSTDSRLYALHDDNNGLAETTWPMYGHDPAHTGRTRDIDPTNYRPYLDPIPDISITENDTLNFRVTAGDPDGDELSFTASGELNEYFDPDTQMFNWDPKYDDSGQYTISFEVSDGEYSDSTSVLIDVEDINQPPQITEIEDKTIDENESLSFTVQANDPNGDSIEISASGDLSQYFDPADNSFNWDTTYQDAGTYELILTATDGDMESNETVNITVNNVDRPPVMEPIEDKTISENTRIDFTLSAEDPDNEDQVTYKANGLPDNATLDSYSGEFRWTPNYEQSGIYGIEFIAESNDKTDSQVVNIQVDNVNRAPQFELIEDKEIEEDEQLQFEVKATDEDGDPISYSASGSLSSYFDPTTRTFDWTPGYHDEGTYDITFAASDGEETTTTTVTITVNEYDQPPVIEPIDDQSIQEKENIVLNVQAYDPDNDPVTLGVQNIPNGATFDEDNAQFSWIPTYEQGRDEPYTVTFTASANGKTSTETVNITVNNKNRAPEIGQLDDKIINEGDTLSFIIPATDPDGDDLNYTATGDLAGYLDSASRTFEWKADHDSAGNYTITFIVKDETKEDRRSINITVGNVDRPPVISTIGDQVTKEDNTLNFEVKANDPDGDPIELSAYYHDNKPAGANFDPDTGEFTWQPGFLQAGVYDITFIASSKGLNDTETIQILVKNNNREPTISVDKESPLTVSQGDDVTIQVSASDPDSDDTLSFNATGDLVQYFDEETGTFDWTAGDPGTYQITFIVSDDKGGSDSTTFEIEVQ